MTGHNTGCADFARSRLSRRALLKLGAIGFTGGRTASAVARLRPRRPVLGLTHHEYAWRQMAIEWGVIPLRIPECADVEELWDRSLDAARESGVVEPGDRVVITAGTAVNVAGSTNVIKVETV